MKTAQILSSLFVASVLLTSACTPADKAVTDSDNRRTFQEKFNRKAGPGGGSQSKAYRLGGYQVASLLMDKQVEAIELVRLALDIDDGSKSRTQKKEKVESAEGYSALISMNSAPVAFTTGKGDFLSKTNKNLVQKYTQTAGEPAWGLKLTNNGQAKHTVDRQGAQKAYVNLFEDTFEVVAQATSADEKDLVIELKSSGDVNGRSGQDSFKESFEMKVTVQVDKASLLTETVKIVKMNGELSFKKPDGGFFKVAIEGKGQELKAQGLCNKLVGTSVIKSDRSGKKIVFSEDEMVIDGTNFKMSLGDCGKRPTVDLSRLLP